MFARAARLKYDLARGTANVHLKFKANDRRPGVSPDQAARAPTARSDHLADQMADVLHRVSPRGNGVLPRKAKQSETSLHLRYHEAYLLVHALGRGVVQPHDAIRVGLAGRPRFATTGKNEGATSSALFASLRRHGIRESVHYRRGWLVVHGTHVGARDRVYWLVAALVDAPALQDCYVGFVELIKTLLGERRRRAQLAGCESAGRPPDRSKVDFDRGECIGERQRLRETRPLDLVAGFSGHATGVLEHGLDVAVAACLKHGDFGHDVSLFFFSIPCRFET